MRWFLGKWIDGWLLRWQGSLRTGRPDVSSQHGSQGQGSKTHATSLQKIPATCCHERARTFCRRVFRGHHKNPSDDSAKQLCVSYRILAADEIRVVCGGWLACKNYSIRLTQYRLRQTQYSIVVAARPLNHTLQISGRKGLTHNWQLSEN